MPSIVDSQDYARQTQFWPRRRACLDDVLHLDLFKTNFLNSGTTFFLLSTYRQKSVTASLIWYTFSAVLVRIKKPFQIINSILLSIVACSIQRVQFALWGTSGYLNTAVGKDNNALCGLGRYLSVWCQGVKAAKEKNGAPQTTRYVASTHTPP